ncbi:LCP family protein [Sporolactobacillus pectinivorans]|uniref:LCP family protein n=1 Tax=Sporolactobacillus pectinivorans TaxID=1591408 RepID=UPI001EFCE2F4|nr:LCP family protein [Sporolactobacillus pectinivorans]
MAQISTDSESRHSLKKSKKHHKVLRYTLLILAALILVAAGVFAYESHQLSPQTHFSHLKAIGSPNKNNNALSKYKEKSGVFNVLLIGSDARKTDPAGHTDSILLIHADLNNHKYDVLSIPRDTRVYMSGYGYTKLTSVQYVSQINHGTKQGILDAISAISNLTGVPVNYYAETNYWGLQDMVDAIGGIQMNVPFNVTLTHPWYPEDKNMTFSAGMHTLNGKMVTEIVHERDSVPGTDYGRQQLQEAALIGIAKKVMQPSNITKLPALSQSTSKFLIGTNMTTDDMISMGLGVRSDFHPEQQIQYHQVKGQNAVMYDDILKANNDEVVLDPGQLKSVVQKYFTN